MKKMNAAACVALLMMMALSACDSGAKQAQPVAPSTPAEQPAAAAPAEKPAAPSEAAPAAKIYTMDAPAVEFKAGEQGAAALTITPAEGFKVNLEYPWKAELSADGGLTLPSATLAKDAWKLDAKAASLSIPVESAAAADGSIKASLKFSICNEDKCELLKEDVTVKVAAK